VTEWHCEKCEGVADVPEHHRLCPKRDPSLKIRRIVHVVWPPFGNHENADEPGSPR
jgi:hypothetical protein